MTKVADTGASSDVELPSQASVFVMAISLAALAGFVDAAGYLHFHQLFVSFMSGNSTQAMVAAAGRDLPGFSITAQTIALFVLGVAIGETIGATSARWGRSRVLLFETGLLGAALTALQLGLGEGWTASALALAMGTQNAAVHRAEGIAVSLTYVTGTLVQVGRSIAKALRGAASWSAALPYLGLWTGLIIGGFAGALVAGHSLTAALIAAVAAAVLLLVWALVSALREQPV